MKVSSNVAFNIVRLLNRGLQDLSCPHIFDRHIYHKYDIIWMDKNKTLQASLKRLSELAQMKSEKFSDGSIRHSRPVSVQ